MKFLKTLSTIILPIITAVISIIGTSLLICPYLCKTDNPGFEFSLRKECKEKALEIIRNREKEFCKFEYTYNNDLRTCLLYYDCNDIKYIEDILSNETIAYYNSNSLEFNFTLFSPSLSTDFENKGGPLILSTLNNYSGNFGYNDPIQFLEKNKKLNKFLKQKENLFNH